VPTPSALKSCRGLQHSKCRHHVVERYVMCGVRQTSAAFTPRGGAKIPVNRR
jgi:hypothetical protein